MPLAQAHPFEPMPVTHEEEMQEVSDADGQRGCCGLDPGYTGA